MARLKKLHPLAYAISTLDQTIKELKLRRAELVAQLPNEPVHRLSDHIVNPATGKRERWRKNKEART